MGSSTFYDMYHCFELPILFSHFSKIFEQNLNTLGYALPADSGIRSMNKCAAFLRRLVAE